MGTRGPVPKRSEDRKRSNAPEVEVKRGRSGMTESFKRPKANPDWSYAARRLWDDAKRSGHSRFYEPSDWTMAYILCNVLTAFEETGYSNGQMLASINAMSTELLLTEGARRRAGIELVRDDENSEDLAVIEDMEQWAALTRDL